MRPTVVSPSLISVGQAVAPDGEESVAGGAEVPAGEVVRALVGTPGVGTSRRCGRKPIVVASWRARIESHGGKAAMQAALTDVRQISKIAYGFFASKALFAALNIGLFGHLAAGRQALGDLSAATGVAENRLATLLAYLGSVGLLVRDEAELWSNAPAAARYLVPGEPAYFGDYYRFQIDRQLYPNMITLDAGLAGDEARLAHHSMGGMLSDPVEAEAFCRAQHAGSLGPALTLAKTLDLSDASTLRDVAEAGLSDRIALLPGDALETGWPAGQDVVLVSYLLSAVGAADIPALLGQARRALKPGGRIIIHDFMLDEDRAGPFAAAGFFLSYLTLRTDPVSFTAGDVRRWLADARFDHIESGTMIPEITGWVMARSSHQP